MTIERRIQLITQILQEDGKENDDEAFLKEKIELLQMIIADPAKYIEFDNQPTYQKYNNLLTVAKEINAADTEAIEEWKIPIEKKIETCQNELEDVAPARLDESLKKKKRDLYAGVIGRDKANEIQKHGKPLNAEIEELRQAAKEVSSGAVEMIDSWKLSKDQEDYIFIQEKLNEMLNSSDPKITREDIERMKAIKAGLDEENTKIEESKIRADMKRFLGSSTINLIFEALERRSSESKEIETNSNKQQKDGAGLEEH